MPVRCDVEIEDLDLKAFGELDYRVMAHVFASSKELGRLADENIYQADIAARLREEGLRVGREVPPVASFGSFLKHYYLDIVAGSGGVYELKTASKLTLQHQGRLMNYLLMLGLRHGKVVNLRTASVESRFVNSSVTHSLRHKFDVVSQHWKGCDKIRETVIELIHDWGVGLEVPLYHQAIVHLLGGEELTTRQLPLIRDGVSLGSQRFYLMDDHAAFRVTAYEQPSHGLAQEIARLIRFSPLRQMHWINISRSQLLFTSLL